MTITLDILKYQYSCSPIEKKDIQVDKQHEQPKPKITIGEPTHYTRPGVYIADIPNASFFKKPNEKISIGTPETFKIGQRPTLKSVGLSLT